MSKRSKANKFAVAAVCTAAVGNLIGCALMEKGSSPTQMAQQERSYAGQPTYDDAESNSVSEKDQSQELAVTTSATTETKNEPAPEPMRKQEAKPMEQPPPPPKTIADTRSMSGLGVIGTGNGGGGAVALGGALGTKGMGVGHGMGGVTGPTKKMPVQKPTGGSGGYLGDEGGDGTAQSGVSGNSYDKYRPNPWTATAEDRFSTFAADVDTASYTQMRRFITGNTLPPPASVRVEEYVNYFNYQYAPPKEGAFAVHLEGAPSPFTAGRHLLKIGVKGKVISKSERKPAHLVFLVDTSGSMSSEDKLPLAQETLKVLVNNLNENDTLALVTYAGSVRDVLPPTSANDRAKIFAAIDQLQSGGGTAMGDGMELAYKHAVKQVSSRSVSRVIVLTDGDTNIGQNQSANAMLGSIKNHVAEGVTLTMVGFGMGNYRDSLMEKLADAGNGNCFYVDSMKEARRVFQEKLAGTLEVIAKDVKLQVEFNPEAVASYRLLGYENRDIADKDFRNDKVDAGEIGAGHTVTALYEVQLTGGSPEKIATVRVRAKEPSGSEAKEQAFNFGRDRINESLQSASADLRFAASVAGTADILRGNPQSESFSLAAMEQLAKGAAGENADRQEFVSLIHQARALIGDVAVAKK